MLHGNGKKEIFHTEIGEWGAEIHSCTLLCHTVKFDLSRPMTLYTDRSNSPQNITVMILPNKNLNTSHGNDVFVQSGVKPKQ